ncbi:MAG: Sir2 family NAD-dependent protein deacetylase [Planctomycetota bacterium]|jgi:NAD-dependent deacetylase|nr:Sir2 family NAD-dependent protein deacetylase [Planctomycetota bacterium]MDP7134368.1 Sir2 family NAD-dependent protein deacetylase [Planctomycetota bacterium]MDP7251357.1 Sir2 family NAD-dependent protein deacetylase [Planctomycetota bacterium]
MSPAEEQSRQLADVFRATDRIVIFTGAGISTESGIPDFRSPGGVWTKYKPVMFQEFLDSEDARKRYWVYKKEGFPDFAAAAPNAGHQAIVELEKRGKLQALITQNIDGLHEAAGSSTDLIFELHGTERWVDCLECGRRYARAEVQEWLEAGTEVPRCESCKGIMKPATISFGQHLPEDVLTDAVVNSESCEAFLVIGSSLQVQPAANLCAIAKESGAWIGILNRDETPYDSLADWRSGDSAGEILSMMIELL